MEQKRILFLFIFSQAIIGNLLLSIYKRLVNFGPYQAHADRGTYK